MPKIPTITSEISARAGRPGNALPQTRASGDDFGAQIGRATGVLAEGISSLGAGVQSLAEKRSKETVANAVAQSDFTKREMEIRNEIGPTGAGYYDRVREEYAAYVDEQAELIDDDFARTEYRNKMLSQMPQVSARSATYEAAIAATNSKEQANASLTALQNKLVNDPTLYETYVAQGIDVIDTRTDLSATIREGMKVTWRQDAARMRFEGMLENAKSVADIDAVANELLGRTNGAVKGETPTDWAAEFSPADYRTMVNAVGTARKAFVTKADADARAAIDTIVDRASDVNTLIPQKEMSAVQLLVRQSENPVTAARMARIVRNEEIKKQSATLTPQELRAQINAASGRPDISYPGLPTELSGAVNNAASRFDVSASYLGNTAQREYGMYLKAAPAKGNAAFAPTAVHDGVDFRNMQPEVYDALTVAGENLGFSLQATSAYRSQAKQDSIRAKGDPNRITVAKESYHTKGTAVDISTVGWPEKKKAQVVAALADAGFTGFGEYGTHIHADFRDKVPKSFNAGAGWGGWTNLSPEIMQELVNRGFAAEAPSNTIKRSHPVAFGEGIDYGRGTSATKPDGSPASSALGVAQFTTGTFLEVMKTPGMAGRMGIDISGMSDDQILEMRKDPNISIMAAAAYAEQNKRVLTQTLGRNVTDAELYMAHLLGASGAVALLSGVKAKPNQSAADLLPEAASGNRSLFYSNGKPRTVKQLYDNIAVAFDTSDTQVAFGDNEMRKKVLKNMEDGLSNDPMQFVQENGVYSISPLDVSQGFARRGAEAMSVADMYSIPRDQIKPFTEDEASSLAKDMADGSVDDVLEIMTAIQDMGPTSARAAYKQLDEKEPVYAYAAGLQSERGGRHVASDIVRGQKRLEDNPDIKNTLGTERDVYDAFVRATGGSLYGIAPDQRQAIQDAAVAHYVETVLSRGRGQGLDENLFNASVQAVLGGTQGAPAIAEVNGQTTVLPKGVSAHDIEQAMDRMTVDDWAVMSIDKLPPRYIDGNIIAPDDLADEAGLRPIGDGQYNIVMSDGTLATTGELGQNGRMKSYVFVADADKLKEFATRPAPEQPATEDYYRNSESVLRGKYGVLYRFDENGRWLGPAEASE